MSEQENLTIGEYLKSEREKKDYSISYVGQQTKISPRTIENIEANNLDKLPAKIYVQGFVKSYAKLLGLNQSECVALFKKTFQVEIKPEQPVVAAAFTKGELENTPISESHSKNSKEEILKKLTDFGSDPKAQIAIGAVVLILIILFINSISGGPDSSKSSASDRQIIKKTSLVKPIITATPETKDQALEEVKEVVVKPTKIVQETPKKKEVTPVVAIPTIAPTVVATPKPAPKVEKEKLKKEERKYTFRALPTSIYSFNTEMSEDQINEYIPPQYRNAIISDTQNIFINAFKEDTWITYKKDDDRIKKFILKKGRTFMIRGDLVRLFLGNVHATKIFLDNNPLILKSKSGVKSLIFPRERAPDFMIPLFIYNKDGSVQTSEDYIKENGL